jgi:hypothetical protein
MPHGPRQRDGVSVVAPSLLVAIFSAWVLTCVAVAVGLVRRVPAITLALFGSVLGAIVGFLIGNADGPADVPAYTAMAASVGLVGCGLIGLLTTLARPPAEPLRRAAPVVLIAAPFAAAALAVLLQLACPLYVSGVDAGFCDYRAVDQLGGWVTGVIVVFLVDAMFMAGLLLLSARQAGRSDTDHSAGRATRRVTAPSRSADNAP